MNLPIKKIFDNISSFDGISGTDKGVVYLNDRGCIYKAYEKEKELYRELIKLRKENKELIKQLKQRQ